MCAACQPTARAAIGCLTLGGVAPSGCGALDTLGGLSIWFQFGRGDLASATIADRRRWSLFDLEQGRRPDQPPRLVSWQSR
jgi:hypothetical protein